MLRGWFLMGQRFGKDDDGPKPLLFLDVDGVLIPFPPPKDGDGLPIPSGFGVVWDMPREMPERVAKLTAAFEPVWATTWHEDAHPAFAQALGLTEEWPRIGSRGDSGPWKLPAILAYAGERPWVWIEDGDDGLWEVREYQREHPEFRLRGGLVLCPDTSQGLTDTQVRQALAFAAGSVAVFHRTLRKEAQESPQQEGGADA